MHELAVTKSILKLVLDHTARQGGKEVLAVHLAIGDLRNLEQDWIQRYFDYISKGTPAEHAQIHVKKIPVVFLCRDCSRRFSGDLREQKKVICPHCGSFDYEMVSGRELMLEQVEVR